ncbi:PTS system mannose/fructose/N-acetylgalactosamine-transporter subunit IIB [Faecalicoccus pleomorphus]|uniref:PTS system mannose/fructose/N-acetylgalactosamine-transporter subunit IIB n=1 Tax=Faecalicoccus pleomorphus TaxID=1323 RepID=UPI00243161C7|nr:PTS sugar transporter subunit IIB [Faecalicoccus pleomorphus]
MIIQIRVDDRLIHGQIAVVWSKQFNVNHMVVANDRAAKNEIQQMALKMATPNGIKVLIRSVDDAIQIFNNPKSKDIKMFVLTDTIRDALKIAQHCKVESINVANVGRFDTSENKTKLNSDVVCNPDELEALEEVAKLDIETIHWVIPTNPKISISKLLENKGG